MTCKDCLHFDACESMLRALGYQCDGDGADADKRCDTFADRSRYVVREKGEWDCKRVSFYAGCPSCGCYVKNDAEQVFLDDGALNFCPNCGADMRTKGEEE